MFVKALIFDVDGTLAETECDGHRVAFNRAFAISGLDWDWSVDLYGTLLHIGGGKERIRYFIEKFNPNLPNDFRDENVPKLHRIKNQLYGEILQKGEISLRLGVLRLLQEARGRHWSLAIATTSSLSNTLELLRFYLGSDADSWFSVIGAGDIVACKKPAPDIYEFVLDKLNLVPENCLVFEDSEAGISAAHDAGLKSVMTLNAYTQNHSFDKAELVLNHLGEPNHFCEILSGKIDRFPGFVNLDVCQQILERD